MTILLDFETRSRSDLKAIGGRNYAEHESTEVLCCVLHDTESQEWAVWTPGDPVPFDGRPVSLAAHNAVGFDVHIYRRLDWPEPVEPWIDTSELARRAGLPGALDALGTRWLNIPKDKEGSRFTLSLSRPSRAKARLGQLPELTSDVMARVIAYCRSDVEIMAHGWDKLAPWHDMGALENAVLATDRAINERGIGFDVQLARRLLECDAHLADAVLEASAREARMTVAEVAAIARSPAQFTDFTGAPNAQAETVEGLIAEPGEVGAIARARQALASIVRGKLEAGLSRVSPDGRLRDSMRYYGAHTGRWSHRGLQPGNMPRPAKRFEDWTDDDICRRADEVLAGAWCDADELVLLLRACFVAREGHTFVVEDFSGVEARALAHAAEDFGALDVFRNGGKPYHVMAGRIFGCAPESVTKGDPKYTTGKIAELACGYGMGGPKFEWTAAKAGVDLRAIGVDPFAVVKAWRDLHRPIVRFWYAMQDAAIAATEGYSRRVGLFEWTCNGEGDVALILPSERPIVYPEMHTVAGEKGPQLRFRGGKSGVEYTYGGKLVENAIQAECRDLLANALVELERRGVPAVLSVHDEGVWEVPRSAVKEVRAEVHAVMTDVPEWCEGFPLGAAGFTGTRYRK